MRLVLIEVFEVLTLLKVEVLSSNKYFIIFWYIFSIFLYKLSGRMVKCSNQLLDKVFRLLFLNMFYDWLLCNGAVPYIIFLLV